jgi:hypothetical protein
MNSKIQLWRRLIISLLRRSGWKFFQGQTYKHWHLWAPTTVHFSFKEIRPLNSIVVFALKRTGLICRALWKRCKLPGSSRSTLKTLCLGCMLSCCARQEPWRFGGGHILVIGKIQSAILHIVLLELEKAQERRMLTADEMEFKKLLKAKAVGMAAVQKAKAR